MLNKFPYLLTELIPYTESLSKRRTWKLQVNMSSYSEDCASSGSLRVLERKMAALLQQSIHIETKITEMKRIYSYEIIGI